MFKHYRLCSCLFTTALICLMLSTVYGYLSGKVLHMAAPSQQLHYVDIDWEKLFPYEGQSSMKPAEKSKLMKAYEFVKDRIEDYSGEKLPGRFRFIEAAKRFEDALGWNLAGFAEYNGVVKLHDGYLNWYTPSKDISENVAAVVSFDKFCSERNIKFLHVICPSKICISEDKDISGVLDFSNQNADRFIEAVSKFGVKYYDLRKALHDDGMPHHASFFVTDGHWKPETGLWAARHILALLRDDYGWNVEPETLNPDRFDYVIYPSWFLGGEGKKFTHFRVKPDDFTMIYPKFETSIHYELPSLGIDTSGDFSVTYDMTQVEEKDYYVKNCYAVYNYADQALIKIHNHLNNNGIKLLIVHDSFGNSVVPFLALGIEYTDSIDLRHFTGSLRKYIESSKPDAVILSYHTRYTTNTKDEIYPSNRLYDLR